MRHEINMYNPTSPGACWVMECQECFGAVLITGTLDYPLVNRPFALGNPPPPPPPPFLRDDFRVITAAKWAFIQCIHPRLRRVGFGQFEQKFSAISLSAQ